jgi:elongation factor 1-alpha
MNVKGLPKDNMPRVGDVMIYKSDTTLKRTATFDVTVQVLNHPGKLKPGYCPIAFVRTGRSAVKLDAITWKIGKKTGGAKVENPPELSQYENAEVEFEPSQPLFVEPFETCAALGRIAVMDSNRLKMLGKVTGTVHKTDH